MTTGTNFFTRYRHIAPLAVFRIAFGAVLFYSTVRFIAKGWIDDFYIKPKFHFPFFDAAWLQPLPGAYMYTLYVIMAIAALCICIGLYYRTACIFFFISFCYAELLDKTYYLNHYYLVTICSFLLILAPANRYFSVDVLRKPSLEVNQVPAWTILMYKMQLFIIYFFAGLSKLTSDWLIHAEPLRMWLPAKSNIPLIGSILSQEWAAYFFSWAGALFDLSVPFLLLNKSTRVIGYFLVIIFHSLTAILFQIGMFPYLMISATLIFFSENFHIMLLNKLRSLFVNKPRSIEHPVFLPVKASINRFVFSVLGFYFLIQVLMPIRFLLYPGKLLWTEEGYRFSWRVMLMEKSGAAFFYVKDPATQRKFEVNARTFLTSYQERMMETQPDMMLQYAHILQREYSRQGIRNPEITVQSYVSLNGSGSRLYIDSTVNLAEKKENCFKHKTWILPFTDK